jgi:methylated-DNA-[protein]-cysteine S-methyltransferase
MNGLQWKMESPLGPLWLVAGESGLRGVLWRRPEGEKLRALEGSNPAVLVLKRSVAELESYFAGELRDFSVPLDVHGTPFQRRVWNELSRIPWGETRSYGDIARGLKNANAVRAVGTANGRNPVSIVVPCHRVIGTNGSLTGYAGGLDVKKRLLEIEGLKFSAPG